MLVILGALSSSALMLGHSPRPGTGVRWSSTPAMGSSSVYDFTLKDLDTNKDAPLSQFAGQVSLVVNVASR